MFLDVPIIKNNSGHLDYQHERSIACRWFDSCGFEYENVPYGKSEGFYLLHQKNKRKKVYICCTRDLGLRSIGKFWFGLPVTHVSGNADTGIIFIMVWEDRSREYMVLNNYEVLKCRNIWYEKHNYFSIDFDVKAGKYMMRGKDKYQSDYRFALNNILLLFE